MTEDEMAGQHHRLSGHEFEQTPEDSEGQESLECCSPWDRRVGRDLITEQQHNFIRLWVEMKMVWMYWVK